MNIEKLTDQLHADLRPPESKRLTTTNLWGAYSLMGKAIDLITGDWKNLPAVSNPGTLDTTLDQMILHCEGIIKNCKKLKEANR